MGRSAENVPLNIVRLVAASLVVIGHTRALLFVDYGASDAKSAVAQLFYLLTSLGHPAVMVFFALSGFWVGGGAIRAIQRGIFTWRGYLTARLTRLWLVLIPAVILTQVLDRLGTALHESSDVYSGNPAYHTVVPDGGAIQFLGLQETIGNLFFVQSLWVSTLGSNTPLWSLAYEFWFYMMFPAILVLVSRRRSWRDRVLGLAILLGASLIAGPKVLLLFPIWLAGAGLAWQRPKIERTLSGLPPLSFRLLQGGGVAATFGAAAAYSLLGSRMPAANYIIGFASLLMIATFVGDNRGSEARLYPISRGANWSYSLYAFHLPILAFVVSVVMPSSADRWQVSFTAIGLAIAVLTSVFIASYALSLITEARNGRVRAMLAPNRESSAGERHVTVGSQGAARHLRG